ncbi:unnamed protein product [Brassica oleracea]|uniref:(rape) hypothetical protein n=1 Tax=Brassica napus TaxID=3708 RepID=A0A816N5E0_BRANA|nr:unnamed protein product [Brassica napus]
MSLMNWKQACRKHRSRFVSQTMKGHHLEMCERGESTCFGLCNFRYIGLCTFSYCLEILKLIKD